MRLTLDPANFDACPQYNSWLDEQYTEDNGVLDILGFQPRPSRVLFALSPDTYEAAFADFQQEREEELKRLVSDVFPSPIAHYFYRFDTGYEDDLQRLHFLRDTWEAIIDVLHALAISECRFRNVTLAAPLAVSHFLTNSVAQRLLNVERILTHAANNGITLGFSRIVSVRTLQTMRELNQSRNAFSHGAAQSHLQAREWIGECYSDVMDVLDDLRSLEHVKLYRYLGQTDGQTLRCEAFQGHASTKTIRSVSLTANQVQESQRYFRQGLIVTSSNGSLFGLRPLVTFREDAAGHLTRLCMLRYPEGAAPDRRLVFAVLGEGTEWRQDRTLYQAEINELRALFGVPPE